MLKRNWITKFLVIPFFIGAVLLMPGCAEESKVYADPAKTVEVAPGKEFVVNLESNPTTGYSWLESHDEAIIELVEKTYEQDETKTPMVGVGGIQTFNFKALKPGTTEIKFSYQRPWENEAIKQMVFKVTVK